MGSKTIRRVAALAVAAGLAACGGSNKEKAQFDSAAGAFTEHRDSTVNALDSSKAGQQVDTTKLGAAKTESILTKARKAP